MVGNHSIEQLLNLAVDTDCWYEYDYTQALEIICQNQRRAAFSGVHNLITDTRTSFFVTPNIHRNTLRFMANTWARHKTTQTILSNGWRLAVVGNWRLTVGDGWRLVVCN